MVAHNISIALSVFVYINSSPYLSSMIKMCRAANRLHSGPKTQDDKANASANL